MRTGPIAVTILSVVGFVGASPFPQGDSASAGAQNKPTSVKVTFTQDILDKICKVAGPALQQYATSATIPDQNINANIPSVGDRRVVNATNIKINEAKLGQCKLKLDQDRIRFNLDNLTIQGNAEVNSLLGNLGNTNVIAQGNVSGFVSMKNNGQGGLTSNVEDVKVNLDQFNFDSPGSQTDELINQFNQQIRETVAAALPKSLDDGITSVLNQALQGPLVFDNIWMSGYGVKGSFVGDPEIKPDGLTAKMNIELNTPGQASPTAEASSTGQASPTAEASSTGQASPTAEASPTGQVSPTAEASPTGQVSPTSEASPTEQASPSLEATPAPA